MNTDFRSNNYEFGKSYLNPTDSEKVPKEIISEDTRKFTKLVNSILNKSVDQITSKETKKFISALENRVTGQPGDPESKKIDEAIQKVREREEMAKKESIFPGSTERHQKNLVILEKVMYAHNIPGTTTAATTEAAIRECMDKFSNLCKSLTHKAVNEIDRNEVEIFIALKQFLVKLKPSSMIHYDPKYNDMETIEPRVIVKIIEREKMALNSSTFEAAKDRHQQNIKSLNELKTYNLDKY